MPKARPVVKKSIMGRVLWFSMRRNYGFIRRDDDNTVVFVHQSAIIKSRILKASLRTLEDGENVQFDVVQGSKGLQAENVTGPNGTEVRGCRIIFVEERAYPHQDRFSYVRKGTVGPPLGPQRCICRYGAGKDSWNGQGHERRWAKWKQDREDSLDQRWATEVKGRGDSLDYRSKMFKRNFVRSDVKNMANSREQF